MHRAASKGHDGVLVVLLEAGADREAKNNVSGERDGRRGGLRGG